MSTLLKAFNTAIGKPDFITGSVHKINGIDKNNVLRLRNENTCKQELFISNVLVFELSLYETMRLIDYPHGKYKDITVVDLFLCETMGIIDSYNGKTINDFMDTYSVSERDAIHLKHTANKLYAQLGYILQDDVEEFVEIIRNSDIYINYINKHN